MQKVVLPSGRNRAWNGPNSPLQLALMGQVMVWFWIKYAFRVVSEGLFRRVSSSFFQTYRMADCSYDTGKRKKKWRLSIKWVISSTHNNDVI